MMHFKMLMHGLLGLFVVIGVGGFPLGEIPLAAGDNQNLRIIKNMQKKIVSTPIPQFEAVNRFQLCFALPAFCKSMAKELDVVMVPKEQPVMKTVIACCEGYIFTNEKLCVPVCDNCACVKCTKPNVCDCDYDSDELYVMDAKEQYDGPNVVLAKKELQLENEEKQPLTVNIPIPDEINSKIMYFRYDPIEGGVQDDVPEDSTIINEFVQEGMDQELDLEVAQQSQGEFPPPLYDDTDLAPAYDYYYPNEGEVPDYEQKNSPVIEDFSSAYFADDIPDLNETAKGILIRVHRDTELQYENSTTLDLDIQEYESYEYDTTIGMENDETTPFYYQTENDAKVEMKSDATTPFYDQYENYEYDTAVYMDNEETTRFSNEFIIYNDAKMAIGNDASTPFFDEFANENNMKMGMVDHGTTLFYGEIKVHHTNKAVVTQSNSTGTCSKFCGTPFTLMSMGIIFLVLVSCVIALYDMATKMFSKKQNSTAGVKFSLLEKNRTEINNSYKVDLDNLLESMTVGITTDEEDDDADTKPVWLSYLAMEVIDEKKNMKKGPGDKDEVQELEDKIKGKEVTIIPEKTSVTTFYDYTGDKCKLYKKAQYQ